VTGTARLLKICNDEGGKEPVRHIDMLGCSLHDRAKKDDRIGNPDDRDQQVDGPFELGVLLGGCDPEGQSHRSRHDDRLPAPEHETGKTTGKQARLTGALNDKQGSRKQGAAAKGKDHGVRMQRSKSAEMEPWQARIQFWPRQLGRNDHTDQHADNPPDNRHDGELAHDAVVVQRVISHAGPACCLCFPENDLPAT
jgi:hypothetical protein